MPTGDNCQYSGTLSIKGILFHGQNLQRVRSKVKVKVAMEAGGAARGRRCWWWAVGNGKPVGPWDGGAEGWSVCPGAGYLRLDSNAKNTK